MLRACSPRSAITLIEVLAGTALMATLFAMMVVATGRHTARIADAERELQALNALDRLLAEWYSTNHPLPIAEAGQLVDHEDWYWRKTSRTVAHIPRKWRVRMLQVEVWAKGVSRPLASVQLLEADPPATPPASPGPVASRWSISRPAEGP